MSETKTICKGCACETAPNLLENPEELKEVKEALSELGFTVDESFVDLIKEKTAGLCALCGSIEVFKWAFMSLIVSETEKENHERILNFVNRLTSLAEESMWMGCKRTILNDIVNSKLRGRAPWRLFMQIHNMRGQTPHVEDAEAGLMVELRKGGLSMGDLAFVFDRSKETVSRHIAEGGLR